MENRIQPSTEEIIMGFVASCIEDVAAVLGLDYRRKTEWNDKQSYDTVINTTEHFLLALPHSKG